MFRHVIIILLAIAVAIPAFGERFVHPDLREPATNTYVQGSFADINLNTGNEVFINPLPQLPPVPDLNQNGVLITTPIRPRPQSQYTIGGDINIITRPTTYSADFSYTDIGSLNLGSYSLGGSYEWRDGQFVWCPMSGTPEIDNMFGSSGVTGSCFERFGTTSMIAQFRIAARDLALCRCLETEATTGRSTTGLVFNALRRRNLQQSAMNGNIQRMNQLLEAEQNAMRFQASTLPTNEEDGRTYSSAYTNRFNFDVSRRIGAVTRTVRESFASASDGSASIEMVPLQPPQYSDTYLQEREPPAGMCIPYRAFLSHRQLPTDPQFYRDLGSLNDYNDADWNYTDLRNRFLNLSSTVKTLAEARAQSPEANALFLRLQFLQRNPMVRNLFSAPDSERGARDKKQALFTTIKKSFNGVSDARSAGEKFEAYRNTLTSFFGQDADNVLRITQKGAEANMDALLQELPGRVSTVTSSETPGQIWSRVTVLRPGPIDLSGGFASSSPTVPDTSIRGMLGRPSDNTDVTVYADYCPELRFSQQANRWDVLKQLEDEIGNGYSSDPLMNDEYRRMNSQVCNAERSGPNNTRASFNTWKAQRCQGMGGLSCGVNGSEEALLAEFLAAYPDSSDPNLNDSAQVAVLRSFLSGEVRTVSYSDNSTREITRVGSSRTITGSSAFTEDLSRIGSTAAISSNGQLTNNQIDTVKSAKGNLQTPTSQTGATTQAQRDAQSAVAQASVAGGFVPAVLTPEAREAEVQRTEVIRRQVGQSDSNLTRISEELAGIRDDVVRRRDDGETEQTSPQLQTLMERLASLERNVTAETDRNAVLRKQLADSEARLAAMNTPAAPEAAAQTERNPGRRVASVGGVSAGGGTQDSQQGGSAGGSTAQQAQLAGGFSQVRGATQARSIIGGQVNAALLSRYGVQSVSQQSGGAIIIADPGTDTAYQQLRADASAGSTVQLNFSQADLTRFSQNEGQALEAYLAQVQNAPGEVVRVVITVPGSSVPVERFILKSEGKVTIVSQPGASRSPASSQRYRLSDLVSELQTGR